jgi:hypothetical protein
MEKLKRFNQMDLAAMRLGVQKREAALSTQEREAYETERKLSKESMLDKPEPSEQVELWVRLCDMDDALMKRCEPELFELSDEQVRELVARTDTEIIARLDAELGLESLWSGKREYYDTRAWPTAERILLGDSMFNNYYEKLEVLELEARVNAEFNALWSTEREYYDTMAWPTERITIEDGCTIYSGRYRELLLEQYVLQRCRSLSGRNQ